MKNIYRISILILFVIQATYTYGSNWDAMIWDQDNWYIDNCPNDPNKTEAGTCGCGIADTDTDSDGTPDCNDECDDDPNKTEAGTCGCGIAEGSCTDSGGGSSGGGSCFVKTLME